ncbi:MAG: hypothetical protein PHQ43_02730 [Dehalococcoidales bacterium]|nr:hypothetical protein [Dehalococcoidales bacterium]
MAADTKEPDESAKTRPASPAEEQTQEEEVSNNLPGDEEATAESEAPRDDREEAESSDVTSEWESLKGSTQERIRQLLQERDRAREEAEKWRKQSPGSSQLSEASELQGQSRLPEREDLTEEQRQAFDILKNKFGVVTQKDLQALKDRLALDGEHSRLERSYDGSDGRPKYDRVEVEDWMRKHPGIYVPEVAYKMMYEEELGDWSLRQAGRTKKSAPYSEKPKSSATNKTEPLSVESIRQRLNKPDGPEWWEKNRERILPLLGDVLGAK